MSIFCNSKRPAASSSGRIRSRFFAALFAALFATAQAEQYFDQHALQSGRRLPSIRRLAKLSSVRKSGVLHVLQGVTVPAFLADIRWPCF